MTQTRNALVFAPADIVTERNAEPQVRAVSWYPRLMTVGPHLALSPAVFWLVASLKPDCAVTLGLGQGHLFFAVAQGLDKLASDGRAIGIAGSADDAGLIAELIAHLHQLYRDNAQIVPADHSLQAGVDLAGINLLIVDPARIDPMTAEDVAAWLTRMHPDAIIALVGGPADHDNALALRLAIKDWQTQHLRVGSGLTLFQRADGLLTAPVFSSAGQNVLRRIGEGLEAIAGRDEAVSALTRRDTQLAKAGAALKVAEARYSQLEAAHHLQGDKRAFLESTLFDQQKENRGLSDRISALAEANEQARAEIARLQAEGEEDRAKIVQHAGERLILTKIAEEMRGEIARLIADGEQQSAEQQAEIARLQAEGEEDRAKITEEMRGEIARLIADGERQSAEQQAEIARLQAEGEEDRAKIAEEMRGEIARLIADGEQQSAEQQAEIARLQAEGEEDRAKIVLHAGERLILTKIAEEMRGEIARLIADGERQSAKQQAEIERHLRAALKHVQEVRTLKAALKQSKATARAENARRAALQQSLSWRMTAPMRGLRSMLKGR